MRKEKKEEGKEGSKGNKCKTNVKREEIEGKSEGERERRLGDKEIHDKDKGTGRKCDKVDMGGWSAL
jgi:hypothetical protein